MKKLTLLFALVLASCATPVTQQAPSIVPSETQVPTNTSTFTPTSTFTKKPTSTKTNTPTKTPTDTLLPPDTLTAISKGATATKAALNLTATAEKYSSDRTATASSKMATATEIARYKPIDWRELVNYTNKHIGEYVKIHGQVFNIVDETDIQIYVGSYEGVYVSMANPLSDLYEDAWIWVYGIVQDQYCFENSYGGTVCQPVLSEAFWKT